jgi:Na+-transporting NADH:ubiquinone oxidoreductase subunit C
MKTKLALLLIVALSWNCRETPDTSKPNIKETKEECQTSVETSPITKNLIQFAELALTDSTEIEDLMLFKEISTDEVIAEIDWDRAQALYKGMKKRGQATSFPIFELKDTKTAILPIQGVGFGGAIWAKVLIDRNTLEIKKIAFGHKAESEGYGAAITQTSFENQFVGTKINLDADTFTLRQAMEKIRDDGQTIDGMSGATMTNQGVIAMVNDGMKQYRDYLSP